MRWKRCMVMGLLISLFISHAFAYDQVLRVYGKGAAGDLENPLFARIHPEVGWEGSDSLGVMNASDLVTVLLTQEAYDLYAIPYSNCNFEAVLAKQYATDLHADATIRELCGQMYPFIQDALVEQDSIFGIPVDLTCTQWGYSPDAWQMVQEVFPVELPQTYEELFAFMAWWIEEGQYAFPQILLARNAPDAKLIITQNLTDHLLDVAWKHQNPDLLNDPAILRIYEMLESLHFDQLQPYIASDMENEISYLFDVSLDWMSLSEYPDESVYLPMPLAFRADSPIEIPVDMRMFFVNPASESRQEAIDYVSCFLASRDDLFAMTVYDGPHEPVINPWLMNVLEEKRQELAAAEEAAVQGDDQAMRMEALAARIAALERQQWLVPADRIALYQDLTPLFFIRPYNPLSSKTDGSGNRICRDVQSFVQGRLKGKELLCSMGGALRMVIQEQQT